MKILRVALLFLLVARVTLAQNPPCGGPECVVPGWPYCTGPSFYVIACNTNLAGYQPIMDPNTSLPGWQRGTYGACGAHTWHVLDIDHHDYPIIDQQKTNGGRIYAMPPDSAPNAQAVWKACVNDHLSPAGPGSTGGGYFCDGSIKPDGGVQNYIDITLADPRMPSNLRATYTGTFHCTSGTPPPPPPSRTATLPGPTKTRTPFHTATPFPGDCCPPHVACRPGIPPCEGGPTVTNSPKPSPSVTVTSSKTPTITASATVKPSATLTSTPFVDPTATRTPHIGPASTKTSTPSIHPAFTKTNTPSIGPAATPTASPWSFLPAACAPKPTPTRAALTPGEPTT